MSGYDETHPETYRPTEPGQAADGSHPGVDSPSAARQGASAETVSGGEASSAPSDASTDQAGYDAPSQAYDADPSQPESVPDSVPTSAGEYTGHTQQMPADQATSVLPADQPTSVYAQSQQQPFQQSYQQNQYPAYVPEQPTAPYNQPAAQQSYQGQQAHLGSPYTSVPTTPGGYDVPPSAPGSAGAAAGGSQAGASTYAPLGTAGESFYATSSAAGSQSSGSRRRGPGWFALVASAVVASLLGAGGAVGAVRYLDSGSGSPSSHTSAAPTAIATGDTTQTVNSTGQAPDWEAVSAAVSNAVVSIAIATNNGNALGSGVIFDKDGHIITNNHVVAGASQIQVTLADGRVYDAETTGTDPATDLAVIQLKDAPDNLTVAQLGDSDKLTTGQDVMAIGNPLGLSSTATTGIISALDRPVVTTQEEGEPSDGSSGNSQRDPNRRLAPDDKKSSQVFTNAIQIDAAINPGNSGGPLFDETGTVIGITSSIASTGSSSSEQAGSIGIGFAIPSNLAKKVADQLISTGAATHAYIGVTIGNGGGTAGGVTRAGAEVGSVESGSPAEAAGLKEGDVITAIDGKPTREGSALTGFVRQYSADDQVTLTVIRDGEELQTPVTLSERKDT
mgnify:CR=1 FL=1